MLAEVAEPLGAEERSGGCRDEHLPAVPGRPRSAPPGARPLRRSPPRPRAVCRCGCPCARGSGPARAPRAPRPPPAVRRARSGRRRRRRLPACRPRRRRGRRTPRAGRVDARRARSAYASAPSSCSSFVEPSTSVKRKVTVPGGEVAPHGLNDEPLRAQLPPRRRTTRAKRLAAKASTVRRRRSPLPPKEPR